MTLKEQISEECNQALLDKNKEKRLVLSTLLGELDRLGKEATDEQVIKVIQKTIANNAIVNSMANFYEDEVLREYLPKMLDDAVLETYIKDYIKDYGCSGMRDMGKVMNFLSSTFAGRYDGKVASNLVKSLLING